MADIPPCSTLLSCFPRSARVRLGSAKERTEGVLAGRAGSTGLGQILDVAALGERERVGRRVAQYSIV